MPEITESALKAQIRKSDFSNLYFLYGEEKYLVLHYAQKLMEKAQGTAFEEFNFQRFDGSSASVDQIADAAQALPLMAPRKCVAVSDLNVDGLRAPEMHKLEELLSILPETTVLIFYLPTLAADARKSKKWKQFLDLVDRKGSSVLLKKRTRSELEKLLCAAAEKRGCTLSRPDARKIIDFAGTDLQNLLNEMEKLCSFTAQGKITASAIEQIVVKNLEARVYDLSKAILSRSYDRAYRILALLFDQNEEPVSVLAVLSSAYLDLYRVRVSVQSGFGALEPAKHFDYARKEFRLTNAERDAKRFSLSTLHDSLNALLRADLALKGARGDRRIVMEKLIAQLLCIAEGERTA